jgi:FixJ family two-component response regulator
MMLYDHKPLVAVVDDDPSVRRAFQRLLQAAGYEVEVSPSAEMFLSRARTREPDCIILDVQMPGMRGTDLADLMHEMGRGIPILFVTAYDDEVARARAIDAGAYAFFRKPIIDRTLIETIQTALARHAY